MKKITFLLLMLFSITSYAQNDTIPIVEEGNITTAERVIDKYSGKAYEAVKELAAALKVPAEHVYTVLVKQAMVESITWLIILCICLAMLSAGIRMMFKLPMFIESDYDDSVTAPGVFAILGVIVGGIGTVVGLTYIDVIVGGFVNPEYYAIKEIIELLK